MMFDFMSTKLQIMMNTLSWNMDIFKELRFFNKCFNNIRLEPFLFPILHDKRMT
jgi:hypothetical protein